MISDLRMGIEPSYVFSFKVGEISNPHAKPSVPQAIQNSWDLSRLEQIWQRIWDETLIL